MNQPNEFQELIIASLLHDVGKFYLRAGYKLDPSRNERDGFALQNYTRNTGTEYQPHYKYYHAAMTEKFFREYLPPELDKAGHLAALHHLPENATNERHRLLARLITLADWLSSGERTEQEDDQKSDTRQEPLISIFSQLKTPENGTTEENPDSGKNSPAKKVDYYIPLSPIDDKMVNLFPVESKEKAFQKWDYRKLWEGFVSELKKLNFEDDYLTQIYYLLQKYLMTMPAAAFKNKADISLFHHLKSTAAIASCLYRLTESGQLQESEITALLNDISGYGQAVKEKGIGNVQIPDSLKKAGLVLVSGDISGIQSFIYEVTSERALKGLRARSFYVQLISEILAKKILKEFGLPEPNLLYCGGGNFYLLIPLLKDFQQRLNAIQREFDSILLRAHRGNLSVVLAWQEIRYLDFITNFAACWKALGSRLIVYKKRKFSSLLNQEDPESVYQEIFGPFELGGETRGCSICGSELTSQETEMCSFCTSLTDLTSRMNNAEFIILRPVKGPQNNSDNLATWYEVMAALGYEVRFTGYQSGDGGISVSKYLPGAFLLNSTDFAGRASGFYFLPKKTYNPDGQTLTLEKIAEEARGIKKWGVLRADVDSLGWLFKEGLEENKTISRIAMLSFMLSAYFSGRLSHLESLNNLSDGHCQEQSQMADSLYLAYSGGDDLFLIGPWSELHELAWFLYNDFRKFTCNRLTLSAGIYYAPSIKFPIYQAAEEAGEAVKKSKENGRNRLTLFDTAIPWSAFSKIKEIYELTVELLEKDGDRQKQVHRSLLNILYSIYQEKSYQRNNTIKIERIWRLYYAIGKIFGRLERDQSQAEKINKLVNMVITNYEIYPYLNIATRVADYLTRKPLTGGKDEH
ncbi:MAG: type III-A CRISPR-associated protein Cas10/Csm1 [Candidatus Saccharicenans sp.]